MSNIDKLREEFTKFYSEHWLLNDKAHRAEHFEEVYLTGCEINLRLGLGFKEENIFRAAYLHDLFAWSRVNHHLLSHEYTLSTDHPCMEGVSADDRWLIAQGCLQHRASFEGEFSCSFAELINSADRGRPGQLDDMFDRAIMYRQKHFPTMSPEEMEIDAIKHLKEKWGTGGYARFAGMYLAAFGADLEAQRRTID